QSANESLKEITDKFTNTIGKLSQQIQDTTRFLAKSEGDRGALLTELRERNQAEIATLQEFHHLASNAFAVAGAAVVPDFWRVPTLNALVILKSKNELRPDGITGVSGLVVRDIPFLQTAEFQQMM